MSAHNWPYNLRPAFARPLAIIAFSLLIAVSASAYTIVLRDGRRIEIPSEFILTKTTLTYELSPGFNQTLVLSLVDIAATERANGEPLGGFFKHRQDANTTAPNTTGANNNAPARPAVKTLTNLDLDAVRQRRVESEQAYESRRKQLGLPTVEESRRRQDAESAELREMARAKDEADARDEAYWKGRARELRNEIAMVDSQIGYLRGRVYDANQQAMQNRSWVTGVYPTWRNGPLYPNFPNGRYPDARRSGPIIGMGLPNIYGSPNVYGYPGTYGYPGGYPGTYGYPGYGYPNGSINNNPPYSSDPVELNGRLDDLLVRRQGLAMQWRQLEDEARDARIPQIWLEP